jgi:hypothetical protein
MPQTQSLHRYCFPVQHPAKEVFDFIIDPANLTQWLTGVKSVENSPPLDRLAAGTTVKAQVNIFGITTGVEAEFKALDRLKRHASILQKLPKGGQIVSNLRVEDVNGSCLVYIAAQSSHQNVANILERSSAAQRKALQEELRAG